MVHSKSEDIADASSLMPHRHSNAMGAFGLGCLEICLYGIRRVNQPGEDSVGPNITGKTVELNGRVQSPELLLQFVDSLSQPLHLWLGSMRRSLNLWSVV